MFTVKELGNVFNKMIETGDGDFVVLVRNRKGDLVSVSDLVFGFGKQDDLEDDDERFSFYGDIKDAGNDAVKAVILFNW